jgi:HEAT repeat protein
VLRGDIDAALATGEAAIPHLLDAMRSRHARRRLAASRGLRRVRPLEAIPTFLRALRDPEPEVREAATEALAEIGHDAVEGLVEALSSHDASIQHYAAIALGRIGDPAAAQALAAVISRNRRTSEDYAEPLQAARTAAYALHSLLRSRPESIAAEHLHQICEVPDVLVEKPSLKDPQAVITEIGMDCGLIRDLARQELSRRNSA